MPEELDQRWEYWTPDPEIDEILKSYSMQKVCAEDLIFSKDEEGRQNSINGFRICSGEFLRHPGVRLARGRVDGLHTRSNEARQCENKKCGELFYPRVREGKVQRFCSVLCVPHPGRPKTLPLQHQCKNCGDSFTPVSIEHTFCSQKCNNVYRASQNLSQLREQRKKQRLEVEAQIGKSLLVCPECNGAIIPNMGSGAPKKYCSRQCMTRAKNRKYYAKHFKRDETRA